MLIIVNKNGRDYFNMASENAENQRLYYIDRLYLNRKSRVLGYLNRESFKIYIFHFLPLNFFTWLFMDCEVHIFVKYLLVVILSYLTVFFICELWQRVKSKIKHEMKMV